MSEQNTPTLSNKREPGYYWVKFDDVWQPAEYFIHKTGTIHWCLIGEEMSIKEKHIQEIDEHRITHPVIGYIESDGNEVEHP